MLRTEACAVERTGKGLWRSRLEKQTAVETQDTTARTVSGSRMLSTCCFREENFRAHVVDRRLSSVWHVLMNLFALFSGDFDTDWTLFG